MSARSPGGCRSADLAHCIWDRSRAKGAIFTFLPRCARFPAHPRVPKPRHGHGHRRLWTYRLRGGDTRSALALADARRGRALHRARDRAQSSLPRPTPERSNRRFRGGWLLVGGLCDRDSHLLVVFSRLGLANVLQSLLADRGIDDVPDHAVGLSPWPPSRVGTAAWPYPVPSWRISSVLVLPSPRLPRDERYWY